VAIEHGNHNQVQIKKPTMEANANAQVEERLATMCATVARQRHCPNGFVVKTINDLLQRGADQDVNILADHQVSDACQLGHLGAFLGVLDGIRRLPKRHAAPNVVHC